MRRRRVALAYKFVLYTAGFFVFSLLWGITYPAFDKTTNVSSRQTSHSNATTALDYINSAWDWAPLFVALLLVLGLVAAAAAESRRP